MLGIHRKDYNTFKEYNRERMRLVNNKKHYEERLNRFGEVYDLIKKYENGGADRVTIAKQLADRCKYKLMNDKTIMGGE